MASGNALNISETGFVTFDGTDTFHGRTLTPGTGITITNGNGVSGNPTISVNGSAVGETITGNTGGALSPTGGNWNIVTANSTVKFAGSVSTLTQDYRLSNLIFGSSATNLTSGIENVGVGFGVFDFVSSGSFNNAIGWGSLNSVTTGSNNCAFGSNALTTLTTGGDNISIGSASMAIATTGAQNICIGSLTLSILTTGSSNVSIGHNSGTHVQTGTNNTLIGASAGSTYTGSDSSNIAIGNVGATPESNAIRIGTQGSGAGQQNQCYIAGVLNTVSGRVVPITTPGAYPYTTLITDDVILVDTSSARTIVPLASPVTGTRFVIKDNVGSAATNNITITPSGKNIDGLASAIINSNYGSYTIVFNGTQWNII